MRSHAGSAVARDPRTMLAYDVSLALGRRLLLLASAW